VDAAYRWLRPQTLSRHVTNMASELRSLHLAHVWLESRWFS
jgi:hypothetical protein